MMSVILALIGPLPSIGEPSASTTRPRSSGPTGTSRMRPVVFTVSPSEMWLYSPRITAPTESRSRLSATPKTLLGNSSISPCITSDRPWMRVIPSVTDTTVPWVRMSAEAPRPSMRLLSSSLISEGLSCILTPGILFVWPAVCASGGQGIPQAGQLGLYGSIEHLVADRHAHAADQRFVDGDTGVELEAEFGFERVDQFLDLGFAELERAGDFRLRRAFVTILQRDELLGDDRQQQQAVVGHQQLDEITDRLGQFRLGQADEQLGALRVVQARIGHRFAHLGVGGHLGQFADQVGPGRQAGLVVARRAEKRLGVGPGDSGKFSHGVPGLKLRLELVEQLGMGAGVDLALEDLFGTLDRQRGDVVAQRIASALDFLRGILGRLGDDAGALGFGFAASLLDQRGGLLFGLDDAGMGFGFGRSLDQTDARLGLGQVGLALL